MAFNIERIEKAAKQIGKFAKKDEKRPDVESIHKLRTNTRRLESALNALQRNASRDDRRLLRDLARVRKRAGTVRDMDVLTADALTVHAEGEEECLVTLVQHLGARRKKAAGKLREELRERGSRLRRELRRMTRGIEKENAVREAKQSDPASPPGPPDQVDRAAATALRLSTGLGAPARLGKGNLHRYRLKVKELRYVLQLSDHADEEPFAAELSEVKDAIGDWHDWEQLIAIASDVLDHGAECKLMAQLRKISASKYEHALRATKHMRSTYVQSAPAGHAAAQHPEAILTAPVLEAATSIES